MTRSTRAALVLLSLLACVAGCDRSILDEYLVLPPGPPPRGTVGRPYYYRMDAEVKNNPYDDNYDYNFGLSGSLPSGLVWQVEELRHLTVAGTPLESGTFTFTVQVTSWQLEEECVDDHTDDSDALQVPNVDCHAPATAEQEYTLVIAPDCGCAQ